MKNFVVILFLILTTKVYPQFPPDSVNEEETNIVPYTLPDPLMMPNGDRMATVGEWENIQRPYLYRQFEKNVYGHFPKDSLKIDYEIREENRHALDDKAVRRQVRLFLKPTDSTVFIDVLMYLPKTPQKHPTPVFLGLNFKGNATIHKDPDIILSKKLMYPDFEGANDDSDRGKQASRWPVNTIVENGFGLVTAYYGDLELDKEDGWETGVRSTLKDELDMEPEEWGAIGAWSWGLTKVMDYLEKDNEVNSKKVAVIGHSRLGKTALWAGASDTRFNIVISNESGEGGASLARRWFGETIEAINNSFPHWFVDKYKTYNHDVFSLPVDQHELLSLIAPRPLYIGSANGDLWADPKGQFLSAWHAGQVYGLYDKKGLGTKAMPSVNEPVGHTIRYHNRKGKHDLTLYDWRQYIEFAKEKWSDE